MRSVDGRNVSSEGFLAILLPVVVALWRRSCW